MKAIIFIAGYLLGIVSFVACGGVVYKYYGLQLSGECYDQGTLLGKQGSDGWPDLSFTECKPDSNTRGKCAILTAEEFFKMNQELYELRDALEKCQKGPPPS